MGASPGRPTTDSNPQAAALECALFLLLSAADGTDEEYAEAQEQVGRLVGLTDEQLLALANGGGEAEGPEQSARPDGGLLRYLRGE